jgi:hypothetical protein
VSPASGWTNQCSNCTDAAQFFSPDKTSDVQFGGNKAASSDASTELASFIQAISTGSKAIYSNFQTSGSVTASNLSSNAAGFTEFAYVQFEGTESDSQGTQQFYGIAAVYLNASAGFEVLSIFESISQAGFKANLAAVNTIDSSMLNS